MKKEFLIGFLFALASFSGAAQLEGSGLSYDEFMRRVKEHHPFSKQASMRLEVGEAELQRSRGLFDPEALANISQKYFDGTTYYSQVEGGFQLPTWFGIVLETGIEQNRGVYLNPEQTVPGGGLWFAGVSLPLAQGLLMDERRAELRKAQAFLDITDAERKIMLNDILFEAGSVYWNWYNAYQNQLVYEDALDLARQRFEATKAQVDIGERPAVDTLEAGIQVQNRELSLQQANLDFLNRKAQLEIYLWDEGIIPLELPENSIPLDLEEEVFPVQGSYLVRLDTMTNAHPIMDQYTGKLEQLSFDERWYREKLKPKLDLKYNPINEVVGNDPFAAYSVSNYTWGMSFSMPLFLREERGQLKTIQLKIDNTEFDMLSKSATILAKAEMALNNWTISYDQVLLYRRTVADYFALLQSERQLFDAGESSLFMVNSREIGYINSQVKLNELVTKNRKAKLASDYAFGDLWQKI